MSLKFQVKLTVSRTLNLCFLEHVLFGKTKRVERWTSQSPSTSECKFIRHACNLRRANMQWRYFSLEIVKQYRSHTLWPFVEMPESPIIIHGYKHVTMNTISVPPFQFLGKYTVWVYQNSLTHCYLSVWYIQYTVYMLIWPYHRSLNFFILGYGALQHQDIYNHHYHKLSYKGGCTIYICIVCVYKLIR